MSRCASKPPREDFTKRYQCKNCGSTQRLFVQCAPCLTKFVEANAIVEIGNRFVNSQAPTRTTGERL